VGAPRRRCPDCDKQGITTFRVIKGRGRCATHLRELRRSESRKTHGAHIQRTYGITSEQYDAIYAFQQGSCFICQRAKGTGRRRLAVDHRHSDGEVRGLLCRPCNRDVLGHLRDDPEAFRRAIQYLENPPAREVLSKWKPPSEPS
jgi:hypothetical protein